MPEPETPQETYDVGSVFGFSLTIALEGLLFFIAAANGAGHLSILCATTLALMAGARAWGQAGLSRLHADLSLDRRRAFPGESFHLAADFANHKFLPVWMRIELPIPEALELNGTAAEGETFLGPFGRTAGKWTFRAARRGVYRLGPATLAAGDPLGLHRRERFLSFADEAVVFPRIVPLAELDLPFRDFFGIHPSKGIIEDPAWYEGTREYSGTRPARNIHWKASARLGVLQEKIFQPTSHRKVYFLVDGEGFRAAEDQAGFEAALEVAASLATRFAETGASFAAAVNCAVIGYPAALPLGRGPEHLGKALELLARCSLGPGTAFPALLRDAAAAGAGFVVTARAPDERTERFFTLPAVRRGRILFLFSKESVEKERGSYPSVLFRELLQPAADQGTEALVEELD
jgi:uncharacterized protein (DUF58 family)